MEPLKLSEIVDAVKGRLTRPSTPVAELVKSVTNVAIDSRRVKPGDLFVAFPGAKTDGHHHVSEALHRGAIACIVNRTLSDVDGSLIVVPDSQQALMDLAAFYRKRIQVPVIGITGSSGKSTTKEITAHLLSSRLNVLKAPESFNNEIGVPLTLLSWERSQDVVVLEMAMRGKGQIKILCDIAQPTFGLITSIGEAHVGLLGSLQAIADAKGELLDSLPAEGVAFLNGEDRRTPYLKEKCRCDVRLYGFQPHHWLYAEAIQESWEGTRAQLISIHGKRSVFFPLLGRHNLLNFLGSAAIALSLGVSLDQIVENAATCVGLHGRFQLKEGARGVIVLDDTYNANPASLEAAMEAIVALPVKGRRVLVLGDMLELGETGREAHEKIGETLVAKRFDALFALGELATRGAETAHAAGLKQVSAYTSHAALLKELQAYVKSGDVVLVKGSRLMQMEKISERLLAP